MSLKRTLAITTRLLAQFRHDRRTLGILFVTPLLVLGLFALLFRTDAPEPVVGVVVAGEGGLGDAIAASLADSDAIESVELSSADEAESRVRSGELDAYVVVADAPDDSGALRVAIVLEGTDQQVAAVVPAALQQAVVAGVADYAPPIPAGGPAPTVPQLEVEVHSLFGGDDLDTLDLFGGAFIGLLVFFLVYIVTSVSFLRERAMGTLERLMASPLRRTEIVVGYMLGFTLVAVVQAVLILGFGLWVLDLYNAGSVWLIFGIEVLLALAAVNLGIFLSTFA
ncbi:MAG: ABC transporter permease, partial [Candidatus Limnocylindria bacterium]